MPKRKTQPENSLRSIKSQRGHRDEKPQSYIDASTDPSLNLSKDHPVIPLKVPPKDSPADISKNHVTDTPMNSSKESRTENFVDTSKGLSTDPSNDPPKDHSTTLKGSSADPSEGFSKDKNTNLETSSPELPPPTLTKKLFEPATNPFKRPSDDIYINKPPFQSISITATNVHDFHDGKIFRLHDLMYPNVEDLCRVAACYAIKVVWFARDMVHHDSVNTVEADEIHRIQQVFAEFGLQDPNMPPALMAERLGSLEWRSSAAEYIIHWAIITNIDVDGDTKFTLLPPHVVTLYRDLDRHSSDTHRILFNRWVQLTFGLLAGGHSEHQASAEVCRRKDRIRRFITNLVGPYYVQHNKKGSFSEKLDEILEFGIAIGYHLMGVAERYRWDWTWLAPKSGQLGLLRLGKPPPRRPREEEVPEGIWVTSPALVKETDELGQQLAEEITVVEANKCELYPKKFEYTPNYDEEAHKKEEAAILDEKIWAYGKP